MTDTLERREAIIRSILGTVLAEIEVSGSFSRLGRLVKDDVEKLADAILALSLPAREVSGGRAIVERARELLCDHVDVAETRAAIKRGEGVGVWSMDALAAIRAALATTPAPREKLEADLVQAKAALRALERQAVELYRAAAPAGNYGANAVGSDHNQNSFADNDDVIRAARATLNRLSGEG